MRLLFRIAVYVVIVTIVGVVVYLFPIEGFIILFCVLAFVVMWAFSLGFKHPKRYVKVYTAFCVIWGSLCMLFWSAMYNWFGNPLFFLIVLAPSVPLWYLMYHKGKKRNDLLEPKDSQA